MDDSPLRNRSTGVTGRDWYERSISDSPRDIRPYPGSFSARLAEQMERDRSGVPNRDFQPGSLSARARNPIPASTHTGSNEVVNTSNTNGNVANFNPDEAHLMIDPRLLLEYFSDMHYLSQPQDPAPPTSFVMNSPVPTYDRHGYAFHSPSATQEPPTLFTYPPPVNSEEPDMSQATTNYPEQQNSFHRRNQESVDTPMTEPNVPNVQTGAANNQYTLDSIESGPATDGNQTSTVPLTPLTEGRVLVVQWENFVNTAERLTATVRHSMDTLSKQADRSLQIHEHCIAHDSETGTQRWGSYIEELQVHYSLIRDYQCTSLRASLHSCQQWLKHYGQYLPYDSVQRGVTIMNQYHPLKREVDGFRFPLWETMAVERMVQNLRNNTNPA